MHGQIDVARNTANFFLAYEAIRQFNAFPFFGTLLGIVRDRQLIEGDDDVDFYACLASKPLIRAALAQAGFSVAGNSANSTDFFMQCSRIIEGVETFVDIYFYEIHQELDYVVDRWNFMGVANDQSAWMHVPKSILFPLVAREFLGRPILLPRRPKKCCKYLYGGGWKEKRSKFAGQYKMAIDDNQPKLVAEGSYIYNLLTIRAQQAYDIHMLRERVSQLEGGSQ